MPNDILVLFYALSASLISGGLLLSNVPLWPALGTGAVLFLVTMQIHGTISGLRMRKKMAEDVGMLSASNAAVKSELDEARRKIADVTTALAKRSDAQEKKVIGELQLFETMIRDFASGARKTNDLPSSARPGASGGLLPVLELATPESEMLEIIRQALEENRVDLYLQPVVNLPQRKIRYYEALSRLRSEDGRIIMPAQYIRIAAPVGLMSVVDNLLLFRCIQVVRRLTQKRREIGVFCNISGHTLSDAEFFPQFLDFLHHHRDLTGQIVFEFAQASILSAGVQEESNLRYLAGLGFALSMDQVTNLNMDFARLKSLGFRHIKIPAQLLISGMEMARAPVAAEDLKDLLARNGLNMIVERIENEKTVVQLLEYNVGFGQGYLFGEPKPIKEMAKANDPRALHLATSEGFRVDRLRPGMRALRHEHGTPAR